MLLISVLQYTCSKSSRLQAHLSIMPKVINSPSQTDKLVAGDSINLCAVFGSDRFEEEKVSYCLPLYKSTLFL
jgi:hypothetical protein